MISLILDVFWGVQLGRGRCTRTVPYGGCNNVIYGRWQFFETLILNVTEYTCSTYLSLVSTHRYSESTHSMDPASATVDGNLPVEGDRTVYFLL